MAVLGSLSLGLLGAPAPALAADPRTSLTASWTSPDPGTTGLTAVSFELRTSTVAPGADLEAWWSAGSTVSGVPAPGPPGTPHAATLDGLAPGQPVYVALRVQDDDSNWSPVFSPVAAWTPVGRPFLAGVSPHVVSAEGSVLFTVRGLGLSVGSTIRFHHPGGAWVDGSVQGQNPDGSLTVSADLAFLGNADLEIEVLDSSGTDRLVGWLRIDLPPPPPDTVAPDAVTNLAGSALDQDSVQLTWTSPLDPVPGGTDRASAYDLRQLGGSPGAWDWDSGTPLGAPAPAFPGQPESRQLDDLTPGSTVAYALKSVDAAGNWSLISNIVEITLPDPPSDTTAPATIADLVGTSLSETSLRLDWTAPLDTGVGSTGNVTQYELRRLAGSPGAWDWNTGTGLATGTPAAAGEAEQLTVTGLPAGGTVAFRIRSRDAAGNWSFLSAVTEVTLPDPPDTTPPSVIANLAGTPLSSTSLRLDWTAPADTGPGSSGNATQYELRRLGGSPGTWNWNTGTAVATGTPALAGGPSN